MIISGRLLTFCIAAAALALQTRGVRADAADTARADALFRSGKEHLARAEHAQACPLLAESFRIEPATGSLLALALCHEREGKLASAYSEYNQVVVRALNEARPERERAAREAAAALKPKLSTLTICTTEAGASGSLQVRVNGTLLAASYLDAAVRLDGGTFEIEASAPGRQPWHTSLTLDSDSDAQIVSIPRLVEARGSAHERRPELAPQAAARPRRAAALPSPRAPQNDAYTGSLSTRQWAAVGLISAGVVGISTGTVFALRALDDRQALIGSRSGNLAVSTYAASAILLGAGIVLYNRKPSRARAVAGGPLGLSPWASRESAGASLHGAF